MFNSCKSNGKSVFRCDHDKTSGSKNLNATNGWVKLNVEVYLQDNINQNGKNTSVSTQIFKGVCDVKYKKTYSITNNEYKTGPEQIYIRVPVIKVQAACNLSSDLSKIRLKYYNSHTKSFDIVKVTSYDPDGWGINVILIGNLNYSETQ